MTGLLAPSKCCDDVYASHRRIRVAGAVCSTEVRSDFYHTIAGVVQPKPLTNLTSGPRARRQQNLTRIWTEKTERGSSLLRHGNIAKFGALSKFGPLLVFASTAESSALLSFLSWLDVGLWKFANEWNRLQHVSTMLQPGVTSFDSRTTPQKGRSRALAALGLPSVTAPPSFLAVLLSCPLASRNHGG